MMMMRRGGGGGERGGGGGGAAMIAAKYAIVCIPSELTARRGNVPHISG